MVADAVATGGALLGFQVPKPRKVLYVDGEMDPAELQGRFQAIHTAAKREKNGKPSLAAANLRILTHADQDLGISDLSDPEGWGRKLVEAALGDAEVLVLDNLSSLCRTGVENDADSWAVMQEWLLSLRRTGKTVLLVHHTGKPDKNGNVSQRGTSKREYILNTSILLKPAATGKKGEFVFQFTKARGFPSPDPFTVRLSLQEGECRLERSHANLAGDIAALLDQGVSQKQIAQRRGVSPSTVSRRKHKVSGRAQQIMGRVQQPDK